MKDSMKFSNNTEKASKMLITGFWLIDWIVL